MPVLTNVFEIVLQSTLIESSFTKNLDNVFHYRLLSGTPDTAQNILASWVVPILDPIIAANFTTDYTAVAALGRFLDDATVQYYTYTIGAAGGVALPRLPGDTAVVTPYQGSTRGKNYRGSKHFSAIPSAFVTKDELNTTGLAAWNTAVTALKGQITSVNGSKYGPIVYSRTLSQARTNPTTLVGSDLNNIVLNKTIGTMRRRKERTVR